MGLYFRRFILIWTPLQYQRRRNHQRQSSRFDDFREYSFISFASSLIKSFPGAFFGRFLFQSINLLYVLPISSRYWISLSGSVLMIILVPYPWSIAWISLQNSICCMVPRHVLNFRWYCEPGNENFRCFRPNLHFASSPSVFQNIKFSFFKFGYILQYKLSKMQIFCWDNWRYSSR